MVRYVLEDGSPVKRFIQSIPNAGHKAQDMAYAVTETLDSFAIDIKNCRRQSYNDAANMSGAYNGLQARIKQVSPLAEYIPCAAHSLNLVGECAAGSCTEASAFSNLLQELYNFFSASTSLWEILQERYSKNMLSHTLKNLSVTRWSAQADACQAVSDSSHEIISALLCIGRDRRIKDTARREAKGIRMILERFETTSMTIF